VLYFKSKLKWSSDLAVEVYHAFTMLVYFLPILGSIIADQFLGKYR
jgi:dipeptide/tripeptide permease